MSTKTRDTLAWAGWILGFLTILMPWGGPLVSWVFMAFMTLGIIALRGLGALAFLMALALSAMASFPSNSATGLDRHPYGAWIGVAAALLAALSRLERDTPPDPAPPVKP